jgi:hypothetical protein
MSDHFGAAVVTLECPVCRARTAATAGRLWQGATMSCAQCGAELTTDVDQLNVALAQVATAVQALTHGVIDNVEGLPRVLTTH